MSTRRRLVEAAFLVLCVAVFVAKLLRGYPDNQWDFRVYYFTAAALANGANPYVVGNLPPNSQGWMAFTYPPYAMAFFWPFTLLPLHSALLVFLALKLILLGWLVAIWARVLRVRVSSPLWVLYLLFVYSSTIYIDFAAGNVVTIEQWLVWMGLASLLAGRWRAFVAWIVAASMFKFTPLVLLVMCFWIPDRRRYQYFAAGIAAFAGILLVTYSIAPGLTADFFRHISSLDERGTTNPALLPLVQDTFNLIGRTYGLAIDPAAQIVVYALAVLAILVVTWNVIKSIGEPEGVNRVELILYLVLLAFAITAPRFKNYAFMLVIVPTFYVATRASRLPMAVPLLLIACLTTNTWMTRPENAALIASYWSWLIAFGAWMLLVYELRARKLLQQG